MKPKLDKARRPEPHGVTWIREGSDPEKRPAPVRSIRLSLARDTTAERCGACQHADEHCAIFKRRVRVYDHAAGHEYNQRLPECVAAEVRP
jgi:hypothetical protein